MKKMTVDEFMLEVSPFFHHGRLCIEVNGEIVNLEGVIKTLRLMGKIEG